MPKKNLLLSKEDELDFRAEMNLLSDDDLEAHFKQFVAAGEDEKADLTALVAANRGITLEVEEDDDALFARL